LGSARGYTFFGRVIKSVIKEINRIIRDKHLGVGKDKASKKN